MKKLIARIQHAAKLNPTTDALISYRTLRKAIGWLGILIPVLLIALGYIFGQCSTIQPSISHYYYTNTRELFVGILSSVALFLFCYKGWSKLDNRCANWAGACGLLVALFPTDIIKSPSAENGAITGYFKCQANLISLCDVKYHGTIHLVAAACFFLILSFMSIVLFTISDESPENQTRHKRKRNSVYQICGVVMILCVFMIAGNFVIGNKEDDSPFTLVFESIALLAFGFSWLTKGEAIFPDKEDDQGRRIDHSYAEESGNKIIKTSVWAFIIGSVLLFLIHFVGEPNSGFHLEELGRDLGIALVVAGIISLIYERSTRLTERKDILKTAIDETLATYIPAMIWTEVKEEVLLRKAYRSNMVMNVKIFNDKFERPGGQIIEVPKGQIIIETTVSYHLSGVLKGEYSVDVDCALDYHMLNNDINLPCFTSCNVYRDEVAIKRFSIDNLELIVKAGHLKLNDGHAVKVSRDYKVRIEVKRYELVSFPGLYTMIMPELVVPAELEDSSVRVVFDNYEDVIKALNITVYNWHNSNDHMFHQDKEKENEWHLKSIMLPGQSYSLVFSAKPKQ